MRTDPRCDICSSRNSTNRACSILMLLFMEIGLWILILFVWLGTKELGTLIGRTLAPLGTSPNTFLKTLMFVTIIWTMSIRKRAIAFTKGRKPRMMASRAPTYGGPVMERDREVLQAMMRSKSPELTEDIWTKNLRMGMMEVEPETAKLYIALQNGTLSLSDYEQRLMN